MKFRILVVVNLLLVLAGMPSAKAQVADKLEKGPQPSLRALTKVGNGLAVNPGEKNRIQLEDMYRDELRAELNAQSSWNDIAKKYSQIVEQYSKMLSTQPPSQASSKDPDAGRTAATNFLGDLIRIIPALAWLTLVVIFLWLYRSAVRQLATGLLWRIRAGGGISIGGFQLKELNVKVTMNGVSESTAVDAKEDDDGKFMATRQSLLRQSRGFLLAHQITPSLEPPLLYDVSIYVVGHDPPDRQSLGMPPPSLTAVERVEYFFGPSWNSKVFVSEDRANGFPITTSAFAKFICNARLSFNDGHTELTWRLIDFEMGAIGNIGPEEGIGELRSKRKERSSSGSSSIGAGKLCA